MEDEIQFITMVRLRPGAPTTAEEHGGQSMTVDPDTYKSIENLIEGQGASIKMLENGERAIFNILGNDYDIVLMGQVQNYLTFARIDAALKHQGFVAKTHPAIQSDEYRRLALESAEALQLSGVK